MYHTFGDMDFTAPTIVNHHNYISISLCIFDGQNMVESPKNDGQNPLKPHEIVIVPRGIPFFCAQIARTARFPSQTPFLGAYSPCKTHHSPSEMPQFAGHPPPWYPSHLSQLLDPLAQLGVSLRQLRQCAHLLGHLPGEPGKFGRLRPEKWWDLGFYYDFGGVHDSTVNNTIRMYK